MAAPARVLLTDLPKGHEFPSTEFRVSRNEMSTYVDAVGDGNAVYGDKGFAPPLAVAARALGSLLELMELPAGTLHTGQELSSASVVPLDATVTLSGRIAQRSARAGFIMSVIEFAVTVAGETQPAITARSTVMSPAAGGESPA